MWGATDELWGWGRHPVVRGREILPERLDGASADARLTRGLGRSYGDASLPADESDALLGTRRADRFLGFDSTTGVLRAEAGLSLAQLNAVFRPRGWASPVSPGTKYVTLGGMVASDVHGKNHHVAGCFGEHVLALRMRVAAGAVLEVSEASEPELFRATLGGMGLTGHVLEVELQLEPTPSPWIWREHVQVRDLESLVETLRRSSRQWPFTMAWVDSLSRGASLGRGVVYRGRYAEPGEAPVKPPLEKDGPRVPFDLPGRAVNRFTVRAFNELYYRVHRGTTRGVSHPRPFFYPLDIVQDWNRLYGRRGFAQYQCVLPVDRDPGVVRRFMDAVTARGAGSFLTVIKDCGAEGKGTISFPMPGISIALDIPMRRNETQAMVDALNEIVIDAGGRIYLAKDALTRADHFAAMEPRLEKWQAVRRKWDPDGRIRSALSVRLLGDPA